MPWLPCRARKSTKAPWPTHSRSRAPTSPNGSNRRLKSAMANNRALRLAGRAAAGAAMLLPLIAAAEPTIPAFTSTPAAGGGTAYGLTLQTLILMTALTFIPAALLMMTGFTRIVIVLSLLRQALGTQSAPPNQVIIGLS